MIECTDKYIYYKKHRRINFKRCFIFFIVVFFIALFVLYYKFFINDKIVEISSSFAYSYSAKCANEAVSKSLNDNVKYSDLITIEKNNGGDIVLITTNSHKINLIGREIVENTSYNLTKSIKNGVEIPIIAFSGVDFLSGYGRKINIKTLTVTSVDCDFYSEFNSVGINQTIHSIFVNVKCEIEVFNFPKKAVKEFETKVLICQSVLVGKVPEIYLNKGVV